MEKNEVRMGRRGVSEGPREDIQVRVCQLPFSPRSKWALDILDAFPHLHPHEPSHHTPEPTLVPSHAGERVAIDGVEVIMVWHVVGEDFSIYHVAFTLLTRFVHGLWGGKHH